MEWSFLSVFSFWSTEEELSLVKTVSAVTLTATNVPLLHEFVKQLFDPLLLLASRSGSKVRNVHKG